ncbi:MAG: hypothetical protein RID07_07620 [Lacipirellulaceae bacterium]
MPTLNIQGRVIYANGQPARNVDVKIFDMDQVNGKIKDQLIFSGVTDDDGNFSGQSIDWQKKIKTERQLLPWESGFPGTVTESNYDLGDILVMKARVSEGAKTQDIVPFISSAPVPMVLPWAPAASRGRDGRGEGRRAERGDSEDDSSADDNPLVRLVGEANNFSMAVVDGIVSVFSGDPIARIGDTNVYANDPEKLFRELKKRMESGHAKVSFQVFGPAATMFKEFADKSSDELAKVLKQHLGNSPQAPLGIIEPITLTSTGVVIIVCMALICLLILPLTLAAGFLFVCIGIGLLVALALGYKCLDLSTCPGVVGDVLDDSGGVEFENCVNFTLAMDASACGG